MGLELDGVNSIIKNTTSDGDVTIKGNDGGSEISLLTFDVSAEGVATFNKDIKIGDSGKAIFGAGSDLLIYHDGSHSYIQDEGTGDLKITSNGNAISFQKGTSETMAFFDTDAGCELYHDNVARFVTDSAGANVTGTLDVSSRVVVAGGTEATTTSDGSIATAGGLSVTKDTVMGDDLFMKSDAAVIHFGADSEITLTHVHDSGLILGGTTPTFTVGDGGAEDAKILFDGNEQNFHIGLDDSTNKLTIGLGNALGTFPGFTMDENTAVEFPDNTVTIISSGNHDMLTLKSTDADGGVGPVMAFVRDSASPANGDFLGALVFDADDSGGNSHQFVEINAVMQTATNGSEDGRLRISSTVGGTNRNRLDIIASETVFNEDSVDVDFRVESNGNANMLHVDGGNDGVAIGTTGGAHTLQVYDTTDFVSGDSNVANTAPLNVRSAASTGGIGAISIGGNDNVALYNHGANVLGLQAYTRMVFMCSATNDDKIGTKTERFRIANDGEVSINDGHIDIGSTTALKVKGGAGAPTCILTHKATSGEEAIFHFRDGANETCGTVTINAANNTTAYNTSSDYRLKENVDYNWDATTRLKQLKPARFNWKSNPSGDKVDGFLAHEVSSVVPEAISGDKDAMVPEVLYTANDELPEGKNIGDVKEATKINAQGIDQSKLVPLLVKTILELEARITTLEG